jgi:hypothetical protein
MPLFGNDFWADLSGFMAVKTQNHGKVVNRFPTVIIYCPLAFKLFCGYIDGRTANLILWCGFSAAGRSDIENQKFFMNPGIKFRIAVFITTIVLLVLLIAWTAHNSWERISQSHQKLSQMQSQSFQIADHLQQSILGLNNRILRYAAYHNDVDWFIFSGSSKDLQDWLAEQKPMLSSDAEHSLLLQINAAFQDYLIAATAIHTKIYAGRQSITRVAEFADFEAQSKRWIRSAKKISSRSTVCGSHYLARWDCCCSPRFASRLSFTAK